MAAGPSAKASISGLPQACDGPLGSLKNPSSSGLAQALAKSDWLVVNRIGSSRPLVQPLSFGAGLGSSSNPSCSDVE